MNALVLGFALLSLRCTMPAHAAMPNDTLSEYDQRCDEGPVPELALARVRVYGQAQGEGARLLLDSRAAAPGGQWRGQVLVDTSVTTGLWVATVDSSGNESCLSNEVLIRGDLVVGVPRGTPDRDTVWFDVAGRRLRVRPAWAGVFFWQLPGRQGRQAVLR